MALKQNHDLLNATNAAIPAQIEEINAAHKAELDKVVKDSMDRVEALNSEISELKAQRGAKQTSLNRTKYSTVPSHRIAVSK